MMYRKEYNEITLGILIFILCVWIFGIYAAYKTAGVIWGIVSILIIAVAWYFAIDLAFFQ